MSGAATLLVFVLSALVATGIVGQSASWKDAEPGRTIRLPADHVSHPDYKVEWWYYTGNLDSADGRRFGYQLTFFRVGIDPAPSNPSRWSVRDLFMAHAAVTDASGRRHIFADRINRAGPGWAGAATETYRVWNERWQASLESPGVHRLVASTEAFGLDLRLDEGRRLALHGHDGFSRKGAAPGNASFYYSLTRMPTRGTLTIDGRPMAVTGSSWMDHEFGTTFLEKEQVGWDWFAVQLDDGRDLMMFQLRRRDGTIDPRSSGTLVEPDGTLRRIEPESGFTLAPGRVWVSPLTGGSYPVEWRLRVPRESIDLVVTPVVDGQELRTGESTGVNYWEGAIDAKGRVRERDVRGRGYLEMTGYAGRGLDALR